MYDEDIHVQEIRVEKLTAETEDFTIEFHVDKLHLKTKSRTPFEEFHNMRLSTIGIPERVWLEVEMPIDDKYATLTMKDKK